MYELDGVKITERGWAGHFCAADLCKFRRNTLLEYGDKRWIVSTVGDMVDVFSKKPTTIGLNRYYETMAFEARFDGRYWDADVSNQLYFDSDWAIGEITEGSDDLANEMHEKVVKELAQKIKEVE